MALLGPYLVSWVTSDPAELDHVLKLSIGFALLFAATTYALRLYINLRRVVAGTHSEDDNPQIRPVPTLLIAGPLVGLFLGRWVGQRFHVEPWGTALGVMLGFVVPLTGEMMTMPGLPKVPAAEAMDVDADGNTVGLF